MVAEDSYRIGQVAYYLNDNHRCVEWMNATAGMDEETYPKYFTKFDVLDHLSYCLVQVIDEIMGLFEVCAQKLGQIRRSTHKVSKMQASKFCDGRLKTPDI